MATAIKKGVWTKKKNMWKLRLNNPVFGSGLTNAYKHEKERNPVKAPGERKLPRINTLLTSCVVFQVSAGSHSRVEYITMVGKKSGKALRHEGNNPLLAAIIKTRVLMTYRP